MPNCWKECGCSFDDWQKLQEGKEVELKSIDISNHIDEDMIHIEQNNPDKPISVIYFDGDKKSYYVKRFLVENTMSRFSFITNHKDSQLEVVSTDWRPQVELVFVKEKGKLTTGALTLSLSGVDQTFINEFLTNGYIQKTNKYNKRK